MAKVITNPTVLMIGATMMATGLIDQWAEAHDLGEIANTEGTPLNRLMADAEDDTAEVSPLDLMTEFAGRHCYRSWSKGRGLEEYIGNILEHGHGSVLEHATVNLAISGVSRALTHELIRHRAGFAVSQESQRYVDAKDIDFVVPPLLLWSVNGDEQSGEVQDWLARQEEALNGYREDQAYYLSVLEEQNGIDKHMAKKRAAEAARASLPNAAETRLVWTGNLRALRHFVETRGAEGADLEIRRLACEIAVLMKVIAPLAFADIDLDPEAGDFGVPVVVSRYKKV